MGAAGMGGGGGGGGTGASCAKTLPVNIKAPAIKLHNRDGLVFIGFSMPGTFRRAGVSCNACECRCMLAAPP
jgi:hypothetical protein